MSSVYQLLKKWNRSNSERAHVTLGLLVMTFVISTSQHNNVRAGCRCRNGQSLHWVAALHPSLIDRKLGGWLGVDEFELLFETVA